MSTVEGEVRRALGRLGRAIEKADRELSGLEGAIRHAEADDFPTDDYASARASLESVLRFVDEETERLRMKVLETGGLEPGRVRRASARDREIR